jgi:heme/copper-type cytochrome/quinol oxidase subunit 1
MAAKGFLITATVLAMMAALARSWSRGPLDLVLHDTYFVVAPARVFVGMALFAAVFAVVYYLVPMNLRASKTHFWLTVTALSGFWISFYVFGHLIARVTPSHTEIPGGAVSAMAAFVMSAALLAASPAIFAFNLVVALFSRHRLAN